jgi:hypothetical protein
MLKMSMLYEIHESSQTKSTEPHARSPLLFPVDINSDITNHEFMLHFKTYEISSLVKLYS